MAALVAVLGCWTALLCQCQHARTPGCLASAPPLQLPPLCLPCSNTASAQNEHPAPHIQMTLLPLASRQSKPKYIQLERWICSAQVIFATLFPVMRQQLLVSQRTAFSDAGAAL